MQDLVALRASVEASKKRGIVHGMYMIDCNQMIWLIDRLEAAEKEVGQLEEEVQQHLLNYE